MDYKKIITSFRQKGFGNCTSIGIIKAAIEVYGIGNVFTETPAEVQLKNGKRLPISAGDFKLAAENCGFELMDANDAGKKQIRDYAARCFAVICKSKQLIEEYESFQDAIDDINLGESVFEAPEYLGLEKLKRTIKYRDSKNMGGIVAHSPKHTVYVSHDFYDDYGTLNQLDWNDWIKYGRKMYAFIPENA